MEPALVNVAARRLVAELLGSTRSSESVSVQVLTAHSRCSRAYAERILSDLGIVPDAGRIFLSSADRLSLAFVLAKQGSLSDAGKFLEWQEFERFAKICLQEIGYETRRDVRVRGAGRMWQIDVTAAKNGLVICIDCKHWATPSSASRLRAASQHQAKATRFLVTEALRVKHERVSGLPAILTLFEPAVPTTANAALVSIEQLPDFAEHLTPFSPGLPFITPE